MALIYGVDYRHNVIRVTDMKWFDDVEWHERYEPCAVAACQRRALFEYLGLHPYARHLPQLCTEHLIELAVAGMQVFD